MWCGFWMDGCGTWWNLLMMDDSDIHYVHDGWLFWVVCFVKLIICVTLLKMDVSVMWWILIMMDDYSVWWVLLIMDKYIVWWTLFMMTDYGVQWTLLMMDDYSVRWVLLMMDDNGVWYHLTWAFEATRSLELYWVTCKYTF